MTDDHLLEARTEVLRRALDGDRFALGELWDEWNPALVRFLRSLRVPDVEDVASDVWVDLARRMPTIGVDLVVFRRVLFTIGRRRAVDARRHRFRRPEVPVDQSSAPPVVDGARAVEDRVGDEQIAQALLAQLPRSQAEVVALRVIGGLSAAEVAEVTGRSEGAVRVMALRGLRRLRELAEEAGLASSDGVAGPDVATGPDAPGRYHGMPRDPAVTDLDGEAMVQP